MDFQLTEDQHLVQKTAREFAQKLTDDQQFGVRARDLLSRLGR